MPGSDINVIDTMGVSLGAGLLAIKAARLAEEGFEAEEIVKQIEASKKKMKYMFILNTLKYLQKGGRLSLPASVIGSILSIKPILTVVNGKLELLEKSRGMKKAIFSVMNRIKENGWSLNGKTVGINHITNLESRDIPVSYTHLRAHETVLDLVCRLLLEKKKRQKEMALQAVITH